MQNLCLKQSCSESPFQIIMQNLRHEICHYESCRIYTLRFAVMNLQVYISVFLISIELWKHCLKLFEFSHE